jgi:ornithine cyclodeaminase/alanine dehydrogenase-like protein (mu-crystallin family)
MKAAHLEQLRGGASGALAIRTLSREDSHAVGLLGSGTQARMQLRGAALVRQIKTVRVFSPTRENRESFAREMAHETGLAIQPVDSPAEAVTGADLILLATSAREPILDPAWISPGTHINAMGTTFLGKSEVAPEVFQKTDLVVVDHRECARLEAGDLVEPLERGLVHWRDIRDLGPLLVGRYEGRTSPEQITLFKAVGLGVTDICLGQAVLEQARKQSLGHELSW